MAARDVPMEESHRKEATLRLDKEEWLVRGGRKRLISQMNAISFLFVTTFTSEFHPVNKKR
jgi:hypothetical protein